jgi:glutamate transport system permease protein
VIAFVSPRTSAAGAELRPLSDPTLWAILNDRAVWRFLLGGALATLQMAAVAAIGALAIGVLFSFVRTARSAIIRVPSTVILEFFRGMPVLLMMLFVLLVFSTGAYWAGVIALALYNGAIIGEILRSGVAALPKGQREAGLTIGLTPLATRFRIEFPQAVRNMLPIIIAQMVVLLKDTALAYIISYDDLLYRIDIMRKGDGNLIFTLFLVALVMYLAINLILSTIARIVARRVRPGAGKPRIPKRGKVFGGKGDINMANVPDAGMGGGAGPVT